MDACDLEAMGLDGLAGFPDSLSLDCLELDCLGVDGLELDGPTGSLELDGLLGCLGDLGPEALGPIAERG